MVADLLLHFLAWPPDQTSAAFRVSTLGKPSAAATPVAAAVASVVFGAATAAIGGAAKGTEGGEAEEFPLLGAAAGVGQTTGAVAGAVVLGASLEKEETKTEESVSAMRNFIFKPQFPVPVCL